MPPPSPRSADWLRRSVRLSHRCGAPRSRSARVTRRSFRAPSLVLGLFASVCALGLTSACKGKSTSGGAPAAHGVGGMGTPVASVKAVDLRVTPDGKFAAYLVDAEKPRLEGIPPQMVVGELHVAPTEGAGGPRKVGNGVTNVPGGYLFSPDSRWVLFLVGYNAADQSGELQALELTDPAAKPKKLGSRVSYMLSSPDSSTVAFVDAGVLKVGPIGGASFKDVAGEVSTAEFSPDSKTLFFKRKVSAAGGLFLVALEAGAESVPRKLADQVGDYVISGDSKRVAFATRSEVARSTYDLWLASAPEFKVNKVAGGTAVFAFSPDSKWFARTEDGKPELIGNLVVGPASGGAGRKVGEQVQEFRFAPDSTAIAYLELYDISARAGLAGVVSLPDGKPKRVGDRCPNFTWGADGRYLAFLSRFIKPSYSVDLMLYQVGEEAAVKVNPGVFGYGFGPQNEYLLYRSNCIRDGRACDLYQLDLAKLKEPAKKIIEGIYSFKPAESGGRIMVSYARTQGELFDTAVFNSKTGERKTLDQFTALPALLGKNKKKRSDAA